MINFANLHERNEIYYRNANVLSNSCISATVGVRFTEYQEPFRIVHQVKCEVITAMIIRNMKK